jgi:polygalacturonase
MNKPLRSMLWAVVMGVLVVQGAMGGAAVQESSITTRAPQDIAKIDAPFAMPPLVRPEIPDRTFDVRQYGAVEGGTAKNTQAIRRAIQAAAKAGGGTVLIPAGRWLTGPIHLESNLNLRIAKGAEVLFSQDVNDYRPAVFCRHEGIECYKLSPFIYANGKKNIAITGEGTLNGQGQPWWKLPGQDKAGAALRKMAEEDVPVDKRVFDGGPNGILRPTFIQPLSCQNVLIEGVTIRYGAFWTISPVYCENVIVRKVTIQTQGEYGHTPNGDGVDPDSSRNVLIEYCDLDTGDDCIVIKSGKDADGLRVARPCENIVVRHCQTRQGHGGVVCGSETSGNIRNVYIHDCVFNGTDRGIRIKTGRGRGGVVENLWARDLTMGTIRNEAILLNMLYTTRRLPEETVTARTPRFRNMHFSNITCEYAQRSAIQLYGLPEMPIAEITIEGFSARSARGIDCADVKGIRFKDVSITPDQGPVVQILDGSDVTFENLQFPQGAEAAFKVLGAKTQGIRVAKTDLSKAKAKIVAGEGASEGAVEIQPQAPSGNN